MIVSILQENLLRALTRTGRIVPAKPQLPILQNVLLSTEEGRVKVTATNLETTESVLIGAKIEKEGGICIPSRLFLDFVSSLPQSTVHLSVREGHLFINSERFQADIPGVAAEEFPPAKAREKTEPQVLDKEEIVTAINRVIFSAASDEGRPLLTGVRITQKDEEVQFVTTDGYRLSIKRLKLRVKEGLSLLIPGRALGEVVKVCAEEKESKEMHISGPEDGQLVFTVGDTEIRTRLIDGEYPNFEKIIPTKHNTRVFFEKASLLAAVKSAAIFARDNANIVRLTIENQTVTVSANTPQVGENRVVIEANVDGDGGDMAFNSRFLLECLTNFPGEEILFEMTGSLNPGVFKPVKDDSYLHIIMPVRVSS